MTKHYFSIFLFLISVSLFAQLNYNGNGNTGFGGPVGPSSMSIDDDGTTITFTFTKGPGDFNDIIVFYLDTGVSGRNIINSDVNDNGDPSRVAISNGDSSGTASEVAFPAGFEASYAIAVNTAFGGLWSIPSTGMVGDNGLPFVTSVNSSLTSNTDAVFTFDLNWSEIGLTGTDSFDFIGFYLSGTAFNSDEAYGDGIAPGNSGGGNVAFTSFFQYTAQTLSDNDFEINTVDLMTYNNKTIKINGFNGDATLEVFDILGKSIFNKRELQLKHNFEMPLNLPSKQVYIVRLQTPSFVKTIKVISK